MTNFHAILFAKEEDKYLAIYKDKMPSPTLSKLLGALGLTVVFLFYGITESSHWNNLISIVSSIVPSVLRFTMQKTYCRFHPEKIRKYQLKS